MAPDSLSGDDNGNNGGNSTSDITPEVPIDDLLQRHPKVAEIFIAHRMYCVGCYIAGFHTLADVAAIYQLDLEALLQEICQHIQADSASTSG